MQVRVTAPNPRHDYSRRGQKVHARLHITDLLNRQTSAEMPVPPISLDDHNIDALMAALEPIFEVRRIAQYRDAEVLRAKTQLARANDSLATVIYPV